MKTVCDALDIARSNIADRVSNKREKSQKKKKEDAELLPGIQAITDKRATYGYRRVHAILNRIRRSKGLPPLNHKRIYRIMKQNNLLLQRYTGRSQGKAHTGKIITLHSNTRWCTDVFEIPCWNKEVVRVIFSLDCCDREILSFIATPGWINGEDVRDLMLQSVEYRFGKVNTAPQQVEWLSDNGLYYLAKETVKFGQDLGLKTCTTPAYSPQSNGMAEAFVKTFKRDYVYVHDRPDADTVMAQLSYWFEDYNEYHPHKGLKMFSPREFIKKNKQLLMLG